MKVAIIPARGGSKRIPRKNIKKFYGKPIIAYAIEVAKKSGCFDRIIVSTDDDEIAQIARDFGAETPFLRSEIASDDHASLHDVVSEVIEKLNYEAKVGNVALILPTSPLLSIETVKEVFDSLAVNECDSALTVVEYEVSPDKALGLSEHGCIVRQNSASLTKRSQEHQKFYHDAGQIYAFKGSDVTSRNTLTGPNCKAIILERLECQDIDTLDDWFLAEVKYELIRKSK
jgi:pseudaminic acid cytidylyltransferase